MAKKKSNIDYLTVVGIAAVGAAGYFIYRYVKKKQDEKKITPEVTPVEPTPEPKTTKKTTSKTVTAGASAAQKTKLQDLLISLYSKYTGNKISDTVYTATEAKGGWGNKSENALKVALSASSGNFAYTTPLDSSNAERYITAVTKVNEDRAKDLKTQQTKQTDKATKIQSAKQIVNLLDAGTHKAKLLVDVTSPALQFDAVKNTYRNLGTTRKFGKGTTFDSGELFARGDGSVLFKSGALRYPINPENLLTFAK